MWAVIRRLWNRAWKYGSDAIAKAVAWVQRHAATIEKWLKRLTVEQVVDQVLRILGL